MRVCRNFNKTKLDYKGPRDEVARGCQEVTNRVIGGQEVGLQGPGGSSGGPTGSHGVKG